MPPIGKRLPNPRDSSPAVHRLTPSPHGVAHKTQLAEVHVPQHSTAEQRVGEIEEDRVDRLPAGPRTDVTGDGLPCHGVFPAISATATPACITCVALESQSLLTDEHVSVNSGMHLLCSVRSWQARLGPQCRPLLLGRRATAREVLGRPSLDRRVALQERAREHRLVQLVRPVTDRPEPRRAVPLLDRADRSSTRGHRRPGSSGRAPPARPSTRAP